MEHVIQPVMSRVERIRFTPTSRKGHYTGELAHEWAMSHDFGTDMWLIVREMIALYGEDRPFFRTTFRYLDWKGYTYWVMPTWVKPDWYDKFDPDDNYVLNRQRISTDLYSGRQQ